jgi:fructan beta-fructosidase
MSVNTARLTDVTRPLAHFTPPIAWLNDPNGLVYLDGEYHVFYQHNPAADVWGPMHWGHAVSGDLVRWEHLPIALEPDQLGTIFSGSAVIDEDDTAGFGAGTLVLVFTHHADEREYQSLAYSHDRGRTWTKYAGNPVLEDPDAGPDFRDPKVFRYRPEHGPPYWVMVVAAGSSIRFYRSDDLRHWTYLSTFGDRLPDTLGVFECPDLLRVPVHGGPPWRWVLTVGHLTGGPAGGSGTRYFVGEFDGEVFSSDDDPARPRWADLGADFYATHTWSDVPDGRRLWAGWLNNWSYANRIPSDGWRGALSIPRELGLADVGGVLVLTQQPVRELSQATLQILHLEDVTAERAAVALASSHGLHLDITLDLDLSAVTDPCPVGLAVAVGGGERTTITYDASSATVTLDRRESGDTSFDPTFAAEHHGHQQLGDRVRLRVLVDGSTVEVFVGDGELTLSDLIFPKPTSTAIELLAGPSVRVRQLTVARVTPPEGPGSSVRGDEASGSSTM